MKQSLVLVFLMCFSTANPVFGGAAEEFVGNIRTNPHICPTPDACYELLRCGRVVRPLVQDMRVFNGDSVVPRKGKKVTLRYRDVACGEAEILAETTVNCKPSPGTWRMPAPFLAAWGLMETMVIQESLDESFTISRGDELFAKIPLCPPAGATVLHGEPVCFVWRDEEHAGSEATLILTPHDSGESIRKNMKAGEWLWLEEALDAGRKYEWHVEARGKKVSGDYAFTVLEKETSHEIRSQLAEVCRSHAGQCPGLGQALYLQYLSDTTDGLDLYADSLRLLMQEKECGEDVHKLKQLTEGFLAHLDRVSGVCPIELDVVLMRPVPSCDGVADCITLPEPEANGEPGVCDDKRYYKPEKPTSWKDADGQTVAPCTMISFVLKNVSRSRSAYYFRLSDVSPSGKREAVFPLSGEEASHSLIQPGETRNLCSEAGRILEEKGENQIVLDFGKNPATLKQGNEAAVRFSLGVR